MTEKKGNAANLGVLLGIIFFSAPSPGATFFVAPQGNDTFAGTTPDVAFKTLQHAADKAQPGDTIEVQDGTYSTDEWTVVDFHHGGSASAPLTIQAAHPRKAVVGSANKTKYGFAFEPNVGYIVIRAFAIEAIREAGIIIGASNHHIQIVDNHLRAIGRECSDTNTGHSGIFVEGKHHVIRGNHFDNIGRLNPGEQGCVLQTTNYQNHDHGIYAAGAENLTIVANTFGPMRQGWAIQIYREAGDRSRNMTIVNNTFEGANPHRDGTIELGSPGLDTGLIADNKFIRPRGAAISYSEGDLTNVVIKNNQIVGDQPICSRGPAARNKGISFINNSNIAH